MLSPGGEESPPIAIDVSSSQDPPLPLPAPPPPNPRRLPPPCWSHDETIALIDAYRDKWYALRRGNLKANHWQEVADDVGIRCPGATPPKTAVQCRHKMEKLRKRYRTEIQRARSMPLSRFSSSWVHFNRMDSMEMVSQPIRSGGPGADDSIDNDEDEDDDDLSNNLINPDGGGGYFYPQHHSFNGSTAPQATPTAIRSVAHKLSNNNSAYDTNTGTNYGNNNWNGMEALSASANGGGGGGGFRIRIPTGVSIAQLAPTPTPPPPSHKFHTKVNVPTPASGFNPNPKPNYGMGPSMVARGAADDLGKKRERDDGDPIDEMVAAVKLLGDGFVRMEQMKMEMAREMEAMRMEMEMKRTQMILDSQQRIVQAFAKAFSNNKKKPKMMQQQQQEDLPKRVASLDEP